MKINISLKTQELIYKNQEKNFGGVIPPKWGVDGQVRDHFTSKNNSAELRFNKLLETVVLNKRMKILDLGCGYGFLVAVLRNKGFQAYGCDNDSESIEVGKRILSENSIRQDIIVKNEDKLPYKDNAFDLIYLNHVLAYVKNLPFFFKEIRRVLKKSGKVYLVTPNYQCPYDINYGVFFLYFLPRTINRIYLKLLGRKASFADDLTYTTKKSLERVFEESNFRYNNIGVKEWVRILDEEDFSLRSPYLKYFILLVKNFRLKPVYKLLASQGFYTPLIYILEKKRN